VINDRRAWLAYVGACLLAWLLYVLAGTEFQRGLWQFWQAVHQATLSLWPPMLLGILIYPWVRALQRQDHGLVPEIGLHTLAALAFGLAWLGCEYLTARWLYGADHAHALLRQTALWRLLWGGVVYAAIATGFAAHLNARRARAAVLAAAQAESALARAELAAISGKLNPHFLFNTLNSLIALTRKDARAAEEALLRFSGMLRYVLDSKRGASGRVALADEIDFVRDYLALEHLRLGSRLHVDWQIDPAALQDEIPPLSLQPLVENSVVHGVAPRAQGGNISIRAARDAGRGLVVSVVDDGPGCDAARLAQAPKREGIGLASLKRRFALDYEGRASLQVQTSPGNGFRVDLLIPQ
jgi:signal transduction histidine kinase